MGDTVLIETTADEVVSIVTVGPQGPSGSEAATLTTTGDLLYRAALANDRLPIGSEGQVLKVSSGLPAWGNESGAVTSVNDQTGTVVLDASDVGAATAAQGSLADTAVQPGDLATVATSGDYDDLSNKPSTFTPSTHASTHATGGSDAIAPSDIGAQSIFENIGVGPISADTTLTANRAARYNILNFSGARNVTLPTTNVLAGDVAIVSSPATNGNITIRRSDGAGGFVTLATIVTSGGGGDLFRFYTVGPTAADWRLDQIPNHTHAASDITSGTLTHQVGGLEADVSAYDGLLKISGGSTSAVTVTTAGEALLDDADAAAQRSTLGLGNSAILDTGTTAGTVAAGDHTHELNALDATGATDGHVLTADGAGGAAFEALPSTALNDLSNVSAAAPNDNDVLVFDNATSTWVAEAPAAGGGSSIMQSIAVGFVLN